MASLKCFNHICKKYSLKALHYNTSWHCYMLWSLQSFFFVVQVYGNNCVDVSIEYSCTWNCGNHRHLINQSTKSHHTHLTRQAKFSSIHNYSLKQRLFEYCYSELIFNKTIYISIQLLCIGIRVEWAARKRPTENLSQNCIICCKLNIDWFGSEMWDTHMFAQMFLLLNLTHLGSHDFCPLFVAQNNQKLWWKSNQILHWIYISKWKMYILVKLNFLLVPFPKILFMSRVTNRPGN
jgi:hypothetical protein